MKWKRSLLVTFLVLAVWGALMAAMAEPVTVDVVDGELYVLNYRVALASEATPVIIDVELGRVTLRVRTPEGEITIRLGVDSVGITERAMPYVTIAKQEVQVTQIPERTSRKAKACPHCGIVNGIDGHICPRCDTAYCIHDDIACGYRLNPAPTRFTTRDPQGQRQNWVVAEDGSYYAGVSPVDKYVAWAPGRKYLSQRATPTPYPHDYTTPSPSPSPRR